MKSSEFFDLGTKPRTVLGAIAIAGPVSLFVGRKRVNIFNSCGQKNVGGTVFGQNVSL
jgi:hypothetical protein